MEEDPKEFVSLIEDVCSEQKSQTIKCEIAKFLNELVENVDGLYKFIMSFVIDKTDKALKDHIPTSLSFTASQDMGESNPSNSLMAQDMEAVSTTAQEESKTEKKYPETLFTDPELCQIIKMFNLKFSSVSEWIEVCLVTITVTSWLLPTNKDTAILLDQMLQKNLPKLLQDKSQDILIRQRTSMLCGFALDTIFQFSQAEVDRDASLDLILTSMIENLKTTKAKRILALEAINTLNTTCGDDSFGQRIQANFDWIIKKFGQYIQELKLAEFFDYIVDFIKMFHNMMTKDNLQLFLDALVKRVLSEQKELMDARRPKKTLDLRNGAVKVTTSKRKVKNNEMRIAKCWSIIRYIAEDEFF